MKYILGILLLSLSMNTEVLFDFNTNSNIRDWRIVDDVVMGGRSDGRFSLTAEGHGLFKGEVSLENNGGFSSLRYPFRGLEVNKNDKIRIRLKGDGKKYQFRVKRSQRDYQSYITYIETTGEWQEIDIPLGELYPIYRGNRLNRPDFDHNIIQEIGFLIGNKKPQSFSLLIDEILLIKE